MGENKYYTPEIEEFHVGFEFEEEFKNPNWNKLSKPTKDVWEYIKLKLDTSHSISRIIGKIKINKVRVKHLDKEDIESLGFKNNDVDNSFYIKNGIILRKDGIKISIFYIISLVETSQIPFTIDIKNKSELQKLLKQLNIQ